MSNNYIKGPAILFLSKCFIFLSALYGKSFTVQWHRLKIHHSSSKVEFQWNAFFLFWPGLRIVFCEAYFYFGLWIAIKLLSWQVLFQQQNDWQQNWSVWHSVLQQIYIKLTQSQLSDSLIELRNAFIILCNMRNIVGIFWKITSHKTCIKL